MYRIKYKRYLVDNNDDLNRKDRHIVSLTETVVSSVTRTNKVKHLSPRTKPRARQQIAYAPSSRKPLTVDYKQVHWFSFVVFYDTATRSKHRGRSYYVEIIITRRKCRLGSLVLFLIRHVLSLESACSSRKHIASVCIDSLLREWFCWPNEKNGKLRG